MSTLIAEAPASIEVLSLAKRIAGFNIPVLVQGETGVGKECIAKFIHAAAYNGVSDAPFIGINCAAIPEMMLESTLFGYEKGAFTGAVNAVPGKLEIANNGTLLLDEIGDMTPALQTKLLRVLQEHQVERLGSNRAIKLNFRLIACTNKNLEAEMAAGRFREDLFYRISVVPINVPPLRERIGDILPLAESFMQKYASQNDWQNMTLSKRAKNALLNYHWPGNVRQLENTIQRGMILNHDGIIHASALGIPLSENTSAHVESYEEQSKSASVCDDFSKNLKQHGRHAQYQYIAELMRKHQGNKTKIADFLGITPRALRYRLASMRKQGIEVCL